MKELWTEKYRPKKVSDYVFTDANQRQQVEHWIKEKAIPHILLSGSPSDNISCFFKHTMHTKW